MQRIIRKMSTCKPPRTPPPSSPSYSRELAEYERAFRGESIYVRMYKRLAMRRAVEVKKYITNKEQQAKIVRNQPPKMY